MLDESESTEGLVLDGRDRWRARVVPEVGVEWTVQAVLTCSTRRHWPKVCP